MSLLSKDQILGAEDIPTEDVAVPEWGGTVRVRGLTGAQRDRFEASVLGQGDKKGDLRNIRARMVALGVVDDNGKRVFVDEEDVKALGNKSAAALNRVFDAIRKLSGLTEQDVEEMEETFGDAQSDDSTSG